MALGAVEMMRFLYAKNNNHQYWIVINGEKKVCKYGTEAFIDWINNMILSKDVEKSYMMLASG